MQVSACHPQHIANLVSWTRARAVIAGEDAIKAGAELYLPRLDSQTDADYKAYKERACFFNATGRTLEGFLGLLFRRNPEIKYPNQAASTSGVNTLFPQGVDLAGTSLNVYCKNVALSVLTVGRVGTLVEWDDESNHAFVCRYEAEDIINWQTIRANGRRLVSLVVLKENVEVIDPANIFVPILKLNYRVLLLEKVGTEYQYVSELWEQVTEGDKSTYKPTSRIVPLRNGKPLPFIPFVFHGPRDSSPDVEPAPLAQMIPVNMDHYRLDADYKHGLHFTALPTPYATGFDKANDLKIGSQTAWISDTAGATAGFLEFKGAGLSSFVEALNRDERQLSVLGSRMLEDTKRVGETVEAIELRQAGENSVLQTLAFSLSASLTTVLRYVSWWELQTELESGDVNVAINSDFTEKGMTSLELTAVVAAWQGNAISTETMFDLFRKGEILPVGRTDAEEKELILKTVAKLKGASTIAAPTS